MKWRPPALLGTIMIAASAGCAVGGDAGADLGLGSGDASGSDGATPPDAGAGVDSGTSGGNDASIGNPDSGVDNGDSGGGGADTGTGGIPCTATNACAGATSIGSVSGDSSSAALSATGTTDTWLVLDATEDDSGPLAAGMKLTITLTSPAGANFDVYVYRGGSPGAVECASVTGSSTNAAGQADVVTTTWGESGTFANGSDDTRRVSIEIRSGAGNTCQSGATWSLSVAGH